MTAVTDAVGRYHAAGWKTVPVHRPGADPGTCTCRRADCDKPGKHPDPRHWPGGSADPAAFEGRNVGVLLGPDSGNLADVDLDCGEALLAAPHLLPPTPAAFGRGTAVTHHLFTVADGAAAFAQLRDPVRAGATATIVELRWPDWDKAKERPKAVQTVFPPSLHYKGKEISWAREGAPAAVPGADLVAAVRRIAAAVVLARYAKPKVRHDLVLLLANLGVRAGWADDDTVAKFIAAVFAAMKDADKLEKVLRGEGANAVADARKRLRDGKPMTGLPALAKMLDPALGGAEAEAVVARVRDWLGLPDRDPPRPAAGAAGPKPGGTRPAAPAAPIPPYTPFPTHLLPPAVRDYVAATAAAMNCDLAYSALPALAALGAAIGASHAASPKKRWKEPPYIWAVAIGRSGATKSPPYRDVEDLAEDINDRLDREYKLAVARYEVEMEAWEDAKRDARDGGPDPGPRPEPPVRRAFLKGDVTIEALVGALKDNPRGLLIGQDELAAWIGSFVKYAGKAGTTDLPRWLQLHHAGTVNYTRKTGDPDTRVVRVRGVGLSVTGTIQPGILARVLTDEFRASGFLARLLVAMPAWRKRLWTEAEVDEPTRAAFAGLLDALHALPAGAWPDGKSCPHLVRLSAGAKAAFVAFYDANGAALETADDEMGAVMSKLEGYALRFALIFHCCRLREYAKDAPVTADDMAAAIELTAWFRAEAERVYQALAEPAELRAARQLLDVVSRLADRREARVGPPRGVTARDLQHHNTRKYPTREHAEAALESLVAAGLGAWVEGPAPARGGHPQRVFVPRPDPADPAAADDGSGDGGPTIASDTRPDSPPGGAAGGGRNPNASRDSGDSENPAGGSSVGSVGRRSGRAGSDESDGSTGESAGEVVLRNDLGEGEDGFTTTTAPAVCPGSAETSPGHLVESVHGEGRGASPTSDTSYTRSPDGEAGRSAADPGRPTLGGGAANTTFGELDRIPLRGENFGPGSRKHEGPSVGSVGRTSAPIVDADTSSPSVPAGCGVEASVGDVVAGYTLVTAAVDLGRVAAAIAAVNGPVGIDTETTGLDHARHRVRLLQIATPRGTFLIDLFAFDAPAVALAPVLETLAGVEVVGHNLGFDLPFLMRLGFTPGRVVDTMLASQVLHAGDLAARHGLRDVAARHLGLTLQKELQQADWAGTMTPDMLGYAALDAEVPLRAWPELASELEVAELTAVAEIEFAALPCVAWAAVRGVSLDRAAWQTLAADADAERARLREALDGAAPDGATLFGARNWDSPDDVKSALAAVGVELEATDDDALAAVTHPLAGLVRDYRSAARLATTYGREWLRHVAADGRVYATWKQIGAGASGRMSCKGPNLQQLPRDARYRRCFAAPTGRVLVKADYSQIELRIATKVARDKRMFEAYKTGEDLHTLTAKALLGKAEVSKADRQLAKAVNFGLLYGQGADGLRRYARAGYGVELSEADAVRHRETFFRTYPGLRVWHRSVGDGAVDTRTLAGRRRLGVSRYTEKLNTPIQGAGADGLKRALALLWERRDVCPGAFPVLVVHDEVVVECDAEKAEEAAVWLRDAMRDGMAPLVHPVPVEVEVSAGPTWGG